jgi:Uncharacterized conserved protein (COG2071)
MKLPALEGVIRRRILVNYRVIPEVMQKVLPPKFRPKLHFGWAVGGICLIRLEHIRPHGMPAFLGRASENAAHRIAVLWHDDQGKTQEGVYIPRRDTDSRINRFVGGKLFPGEHHGADFRVEDNGRKIDFEMVSHDRTTTVQVRGKAATELPPSSEFKDLATASAFFEAGALGYSVTRDPRRFDGLRLKTAVWRIDPLHVDHQYSSFFSDQTRFPPQSVLFDCALIMRDIDHEWLSEPALVT